ncbi:hypothetical protein ACFYXC_21630 [Streptomyces sp. NPDC002701]|uniref:hypothetical protein n=1 Tax=Streptomyces sp. NPDC002701 TaxID=3364661 RepID=UPI0036928EB4
MNAVDAPGTTDRVLVIDDDPGIRRLLISALGFAGSRSAWRWTTPATRPAARAGSST